MDNEETKGKTEEELKEENKRRQNAERNREFRGRKGEEINRARREKRRAEKAIITERIEYEVKEIAKAKELPKMRREAKQEQTKRKYKSFIRRFYKRYTGKELEEEADIILKIEEKAYKALNISKQFKDLINDNFKEIKGNASYVKELYSILCGVRGFTDIEKRLRPYHIEYAKQYQDKRSVIRVEDEEYLKISFAREDIINNLEKLEDEEDRIIYGAILMLKCRLHDLRITKITKDKEDIKDEKNNWIYEDRLYINKTKNKKKQIIEIPKEVKDLYGEKEGYLFGSMSEKGESTLSERFQRITKEVYGKTYTYSNMRHLYATYINEKGSSYKERRETAKQSGHSVEEQIGYSYRIEKDN